MGCCLEYEKKDPFSNGIYPLHVVLWGIRNPAGIIMPARFPVGYATRSRLPEYIFSYCMNHNSNYLVRIG
jgi:hypothetical protein